jgi:hypothetical protein
MVVVVGGVGTMLCAVHAQAVGSRMAVENQHCNERAYGEGQQRGPEILPAGVQECHACAFH